MPQVNINVIDNPGKLDILVTPNHLKMPQGKKDQTIKFNLNATNWSFPANAADAIRIKGPDPTNQFGTPRNGNTPGKMVEIDDKNSDKLPHRYTIKIVRNISAEEMIIDPLIVNN